MKLEMNTLKDNLKTIPNLLSTVAPLKANIAKLQRKCSVMFTDRCAQHANPTPMSYATQNHRDGSTPKPRRCPTLHDLKLERTHDPKFKRMHDPKLKQTHDSKLKQIKDHRAIDTTGTEPELLVFDECGEL